MLSFQVPEDKWFTYGVIVRGPVCMDQGIAHIEGLSGEQIREARKLERKVFGARAKSLEEMLEGGEEREAALSSLLQDFEGFREYLQAEMDSGETNIFWGVEPAFTPDPSNRNRVLMLTFLQLGVLEACGFKGYVQPGR